jgi:hypothetical protein
MSEIAPGMVDWKEVFKDAQWFHWRGITPAISQSAADACLEAVKVASELGITISTDFNYRAKLWNYGGNREKIMTQLTSYCDIILGNEEDAEMHFSIRPEGLDITTQAEHVKAEEMGCEIVKLFPGSIYGPEFVKAVKGPHPWTSIMPTGGVSTEKENLKGWFDSGVTCVSMGSKLISKEILSAKAYDRLTLKVKETFSLIKQIRGI